MRRRIPSGKRATGDHGAGNRPMTEYASCRDRRSRGSGQSAIHGRAPGGLGVAAGNLEVGARSHRQLAGAAQTGGRGQRLAGDQRQRAFGGDGNEVSQSIVGGLIDDRRSCALESYVRGVVHDIGPVELQRARDHIGPTGQGCAREVTERVVDVHQTSLVHDQRAGVAERDGIDDQRRGLVSDDFPLIVYRRLCIANLARTLNRVVQVGQSATESTNRVVRIVGHHYRSFAGQGGALRLEVQVGLGGGTVQENRPRVVHCAEQLRCVPVRDLERTRVGDHIGPAVQGGTAKTITVRADDSAATGGDCATTDRDGLIEQHRGTNSDGLNLPPGVGID